MNTITQSNVIQALVAARQSTVLWGDPGLAKTSILQSIAEDMGLPIEIVDLTGKEPGDLVGLPHIVDDDGLDLPAYAPQAMVMAPPVWARRLAAEGSGILVFDEVGSAEPAVAAASMAIVNDRRVGTLTLPDDVVIFMCGNGVDTGANAFEIPAPLANRLAHIDFTGASSEDWALGLAAGFDAITPSIELNPEVTDQASLQARMQVGGFIKSRPTLLHALPANVSDRSKPWPSRRSWENVAKALPYLDATDADGIVGLIGSLVGEGPALEFAQWTAYGDLPNPADVLADPDSLDWTKNADWLFAVLNGVVAQVIQDGSAAAWKKGWKVLVRAEEANKLDVAAAGARALLNAQPAKTKTPAEATVFAQFLTGTGLLVAA